MNKDEYNNTYLYSGWWKYRRSLYEHSHPRKCYVCNREADTQLHHTSYGNLGNECDSDLVWLCRYHHRIIHERKLPIATAHISLREKYQATQPKREPHPLAQSYCGRDDSPLDGVRRRIEGLRQQKL